MTLFEQQLNEANTSSNADHQLNTQQRSLRLRQIQALKSLDKSSGLQLMRDGHEYTIDTQQDISRSLVAGLFNTDLACDICKHHPGILADLLLLNMGVTTLHHLVDQTTGLCSTASTLANIHMHGQHSLQTVHKGPD